MVYDFACTHEHTETYTIDTQMIGKKQSLHVYAFYAAHQVGMPVSLQARTGPVPCRGRLYSVHLRITVWVPRVPQPQ